MNKEVIFYAILSILSFFIVTTAFSYNIDSSFLLRGLSIIMLSISIMILIKTIVTKNSLNTKYTSVALKIFIFLFLFIVLIYLFGFLFASLVFSFITQIVFTTKIDLKKIIIVSIVISLFVFVIFFNLLGIAPVDSYIKIDEYFLFL